MTSTPAPARPRSWTIGMPPGTPIISANNRLNRYAKNRQTQQLKAAIGTLATLVLHLDREHIGRCDITVTYHSPPRLKRLRHPLASDCITDSDNIAPTAKALVDGLVKSGIFPGDSRKHVRKVVYELGPEPHPRGHIVLTITEVPG